MNAAPSKEAKWTSRQTCKRPVAKRDGRSNLLVRSLKEVVETIKIGRMIKCSVTSGKHAHFSSVYGLTPGFHARHHYVKKSQAGERASPAPPCSTGEDATDQTCWCIRSCVLQQDLHLSEPLLALVGSAHRRFTL